MIRSSGFALAIILSLVSGSAVAASISIAPGSSPSGYVPLATLGIAPTPIGDEAIVNFVTPGFVWAGQNWDVLGVVSNGYVVVGGGTPADVSLASPGFPNATAPNNVLAPFWTDLDPSSVGFRIGVVTDGVSSWIVVDWAAVPLFGTTTTESFEVWIGINGTEDISYTYGAIAPTIYDLAIGAEDVTGTVAAAYFFNGAGTFVTEGTSLRVTSEGLPVVVVAETPVPGALPLFATGLAAFGFLAHRRKRKQAA